MLNFPDRVGPEPSVRHSVFSKRGAEKDGETTVAFDLRDRSSDTCVLGSHGGCVVGIPILRLWMVELLYSVLFHGVLRRLRLWQLWLRLRQPLLERLRLLERLPLPERLRRLERLPLPERLRLLERLRQRLEFVRHELVLPSGVHDIVQ
jgi:hypothetical protein